MSVPNASLPRFDRVRLLVVGDVMLDRYWSGRTARISPEAPVPVVRVDESEVRPGGAANVALNIASLGAQCALLGLVGPDEAGRELRAALDRGGVVHRLIEIAGVDTITKLRVMSRHQQLIRLDFEAELAPGAAVLRAAFEEESAAAGVVVLSDYGKGTLVDARGLIEQARRAGSRVLVDPKGADFVRYRGAHVLTPNLAELEAVVGICPNLGVLTERGERLRESLGLDGLVVTRGEDGLTVIAPDSAHHLEARGREVFDVTGAGDTVIAVLAASLAAGEALTRAAALANLAAGLVVGKLGTAAATRHELAAALVGGRDEPAILAREDVGDVPADARRRGERVVMTNGCFDLLHAGHVGYLERARALGDRLLVAVNDDDSVGRLKGPERPVVPLASRLRVIAGLASVDWVVAFSEDTPEALVSEADPDVLVKGGDYRVEDIAGAAHVLSHGGSVEVVAYEPGASTSALIDSIRGTSAAGVER